MTLASALIAINSQNKDQVKVAKFKITQHLNYILNQAQWSSISSDPTDVRRAYPESEQVMLIAAIDQEFVELEQEYELGNFNNLTDNSGFDILKFYLNVKNQLFAQYGLSNETCIMHTRGLDTVCEEKTEGIRLKSTEYFMESELAKSETAYSDVQKAHPLGGSIISLTFPNDPNEAVASAIKILIEAGVITEENRIGIEDFLFFHARYALVCARMLIILHTQDSSFALSFALNEFLFKNYREEIKNAITKNPQYAAELALAEVTLKSASPKIQEWLHEKDLVQHAQHAFIIYRALELLEKAGFLLNNNNIPKLMILLFQYGEHAYKFAKAIEILKSYKILNPNTDFLALDIIKTLIQSPTQNVISFACGIKELCKENIFDQEHIEFLFVNDGKNAGDVGGCLQLLKSADKGTGTLFNTTNKLRIMHHFNESAAIWNLMWTINHKLVLNQDNFDMIFKYIKFASEIKTFIWTGANQTALNQFIQEIDRQVELQRRAFMQGMRSVNASNPGIGRFFRAPIIDRKNLCEKIFSFLPNPEIPKLR